MNYDIRFLERLLDASGPSGFESRAAKVWCQEAKPFAKVWSDVVGNSYAALRPDAKPRVLMAGHIDEIGLQITHASKSGLLYFGTIGGWDPQVLVGQRVRVLGKNGDVCGVIGRKAIHLLDEEERNKVVKVRKLWIDVGASSREQLKGLGVRVGDPVVIDEKMVTLAEGRVAGRAIDNRVGAFVVLEALRLLYQEAGKGAGAVAVATTQEEIGYSGGGARASAFDLAPDVALVVDVTHATDVPQVEKSDVGDHTLGGGPVLTRGSVTHPGVFERLAELAEANDIPYTLQAAPSRTATDADAIHLARGGVPTGLVSIPCRYMHSPSEMVQLSDLFHASRLLAAFVQSLDGSADFGRS